MNMTAAQRDAEYGDLGRCEVCNRYVFEDELTEVNEILNCKDCYTDPQ